ncbi:MAG: hypothetical protein ACI82H_000791 [Alphaproteobacteria bacterium]|jgi:hypothetical protein
MTANRHGNPASDENALALLRSRVSALADAAGLALGADDLDRLVAVAQENHDSAERLAAYVARYDEPAFGLPTRRDGKA